MALSVTFDAKPTPENHPLRQMARAVAPSPHPLAPENAWLSGWVKRVRDQGQLGSCTGHGVSSAAGIAYGSLHRHMIPEELSPQFSWDVGRIMEGSFPLNTGCSIGDVLLGAHRVGICRESVLPYREDAAEGPTPEANADAALHRIPLPLWVPVNELALKTALSAGMPVVVGMRVGGSFMRTGPSGYVSARPRGEPDEGNHCMVFDGYNPWNFQDLNSWGEGWGAKGHCFMSTRYVLDNVFEAWAIPLA